MVCKINFDYEISLSDDNDSISSSEFSTDDESLNKKFVLGDNIFDVNPLKIISVRQLNNLNTSYSNESISEIQIIDENHHKNVPMNNYLCYDESISNFEEESVSESELNLFSDPVTLNESEFNFSNTHLKYELPTVNRFQMLPQQIVKESGNINSISQYCMKEKLNRLQIEKANETLSNKNSEKELNFVKNKSTEIISIENNVTASNHTENSTISPEILSGLSIDVLTEFINGEKSAEEILNQINKNSNKKRKKPKKLKRHKIEKNSNQHSQKPNKTPATTIQSIDVQSIVISNLPVSEINCEGSIIKSELLSSLDFNPNETEMIHQATIDNCKVVDFDNKFYTEVMDTKITSRIIQSPEIINVNNPIIDKIFTDISNENDKSKDCQQFFQSDKESESCLSNYHHESFGVISNCNEELSENNQIPIPQIPVLNSPEILNEEISKVSLVQLYEKNDTRDNDNVDKTMNIIESYENKSYQDSDECKDTRTSSTDSGFHDCDIDERNDEVQIKINKSKPLISNLKCSIIENTAEKTEDIHHIENNTFVSTLNDRNNAQVKSMHNFLDFSSFKFKFINESKLRNMDEFSSENQNSLSATVNNLIFEKNILHNANKQCQKKTDLSPATFIDNQLVNDDTHTSEEYSNKSNCTKPNANSKHQTFNIDKSYSITDTNLTTNSYRIPSTKSCLTFKVNYYSPEAAITNKEEISEFLNFQWLKFCEKYTMYNHNMNML